MQMLRRIGEILLIILIFIGWNLSIGQLDLLSLYVPVLIGVFLLLFLFGFIYSLAQWLEGKKSEDKEDPTWGWIGSLLMVFIVIIACLEHWHILFILLALIPFVFISRYSHNRRLPPAP